MMTQAEPGPIMRFTGLFARWVLIWLVGALPGLAIAYVMCADEAALACSVLIFAAASASLGFRERTRSGFAVRIFRRTAKKAFGLLILTTILFPIGFVCHTIIGGASIRAVSAVWQTPPREPLLDALGFRLTLIVSLVHGLTLSVLLAGFMLLVYATPRLFARIAPPLPPGMCPRCGYDLRASPVRCPECGESVRHVPQAGGLTQATDQRAES